MIFGEMPIGEARGAILAHSVKHAGGVFKKGRLLSAADVELLRHSNVAAVFAARLDREDVPEDEAAAAVARAVAGEGVLAQEPFTGRANLHAQSDGVVVIDSGRVRALNRLHESLTLATVVPFDTVAARQMVATVKVIPFAVPRDVLEQALAIAGNEPLLRVAAFKPRRVGLIVTRLAQTKTSLIEKSEAAMRERVEAMGARLGEVAIVAHRGEEVRDAIVALRHGQHNPILVFGASAIVDRGDVIPSAVLAAGGEVVHLGMPVDPGNLMMFGRLEGVPVIGVPSCARSPKLNGFDWILSRTIAGLHISAHDIMDMGAGGLLKEIPTRPSPREARPGPQAAARIAALVLAAGRSIRMGTNKLLIEMDGKPMIRRTLEAVLASAARPVVVVTGHEQERVRAALAGMDVAFRHNPDFASGLSTSLRAGLAALPEDCDGVLVCLGDMPLIQSRQLGKLIAAFDPGERRGICVPVHGGERGNPVLWGRRHFPRLMDLTGDRGARALLADLVEDVVEVAMPDDAVVSDFDTPELLTARWPGER